MYTIVNGWLNIDKPLNISSAKAVAIVKKLLKAKKVGHAGTLDPLASGVLPIAVGEATKTINYMVEGIKQYEFTVKFGQATSTDDSEGEIIAESPHCPKLIEIESILPEFIGEIDQAPPIYSAICVDGNRAYDLARRGLIAELPKRKIQIDKIQIIQCDNEHKSTEVTFLADCHKGTYIRSLARDIALSLGTYGHVIKLKRTKVKDFCLNKSISLDKLEQLVHNHQLQECLLPVDIVLDDIPALEVTNLESVDIKAGKKLSVNYPDTSVIRAMEKNQLVALGKIEMNYFQPFRVFNL